MINILASVLTDDNVYANMSCVLSTQLQHALNLYGFWLAINAFITNQTQKNALKVIPLISLLCVIIVKVMVWTSLIATVSFLCEQNFKWIVHSKNVNSIVIY